MLDGIDGAHVVRLGALAQHASKIALLIDEREEVQPDASRPRLSTPPDPGCTTPSPHKVPA